MEKLTINHLAPYLPYELEASENYHGGRLRRKINNMNIMGFVEGDIKAKPILRPINNLSKEIRINGDMIEPLLTLYNMGRIPHQNTILRKEVIKSWEGNDILRVYLSENYYSEFVFGSGDFHYRYTDLSEKRCGHNPINNQIGLFNKLYEWGFDVFGLIEKRLAVDINTL